MVIFKESFKNPISKNKNGKGSYVFSEDNYNAGKCGKGHSLTSNFTQGDPIYDGARKNMGEPFMIPTKTQCEEIININNTTLEWTTVNGVNCVKIINNNDTFKYIFFPMAGVWNATGYHNNGLQGEYYSTNIYTSYTFSSYNLSFNFNSYHYSVSAGASFAAGSIRAVRPWTW